MKTKPIYLLVVLLCIVAACKKDTPDSSTPPEPMKKYLSKVSLVGNDGTLYEKERCTWDSLYRLKNFEYNLGYQYSYEFHYDSMGRASRIEGYDGLYGYFYLLCDWKNNSELNKIDYYGHSFSPLDYPLIHQLQYIYFYDELHRYVEIKRFYVRDNNYNLNFTWYIDWDKDNITTTCSIPTTGDPDFIINNSEYDDKHNPYNDFPNILIQVFNDRVIAYNPSKNNPIVPKYEYEYDKDGYPIGQYYLAEDGTRDLVRVFEYYE